MGTAETLIVFSALMALIALVTIGIDWIGKPLKNRRFIPRIYRFDDEKLPVDAYGNTHFDDPDAGVAPAGTGPGLYGPQLYPHPVPVVHNQSSPINPTVQLQVAHPVADARTNDAASLAAAAAAAAASVSATALDPATPDRVAPATSASAFSDSLAASHVPRSTIAGATIAGTTPAETTGAEPTTAWQPGMALDTSVDGRKPSLATKAERFWMATASAIETSHFDANNVERMASGKAPRRANPRTGRAEAMQLTGLRQASDHTRVRMRWPDDAVDPWASS